MLEKDKVQLGQSSEKLRRITESKGGQGHTTINRRKAKLDWSNIGYRRKDISERKKEKDVSIYWMTLRK